MNARSPRRSTVLAGAFWPSSPGLVAVSLCVVLASPLLLQAQELESELPEGSGATVAGKGCVEIAALHPFELLEAQKGAPPTAQEQQQKKMPRRTPEKELRRPITEREVTLLLRAMKPVDLKKGEGRAITAVVEPTELNLDRMQVLLGDVTSLLADIHAREALDRIKQTPDIKGEARAWAEGAFGSIRDCLEFRFAERGGERAFAQSLEVVERFRGQLERMVLEGLQLKHGMERMRQGGKR